MTLACVLLAGSLEALRGAESTVIADATVSSSRPNRTCGDRSRLRVSQCRSRVHVTYLQFQVAAVSQPVTSATLKLYVINGSVDGGTLLPVHNDWSEDTINWRNAPNRDQEPIASLNRVRPGEWIETAYPWPARTVQRRTSFRRDCALRRSLGPGPGAAMLGAP